MRIAVTGGKGGTGKSIVSTALAVELSKKQKTLLMDLDVECPNDHLILSIKREKVKDIFQKIPKFDFSKCVKCGTCSKVCKENAIVFIEGQYPRFIPEQCTGCNACCIACPTKAISQTEKKIGEIYYGKGYGIDLVSGEMVIGYEEAGPVVNAVKEYVKKIEKKYKHIIIDTSAGTHCGVISALMGCELALCVTEPTPFGKHDLELILDLLNVLGIPAKIIINRSDTGDKKLIGTISKKYKTEIIGEIPYKKSILDAYSKGMPVKEKEIENILRVLK